MAMSQKHPHYHKDVTSLKTIDVYRVLGLFNVTDPCIQHAIKKLLVAGGRGAGKDIFRDVREAMDSLERYMEIQMEDEVSEFEKRQDQVSDMKQSHDLADKNLERVDPDRALAKRLLGGPDAPIGIPREHKTERKRKKAMPASVKKDLTQRKRAQAASKRALRNR